MSELVYCKRCGTTGAAQRVLPGSVLIELLLWLCFLLPGLLYTLWRNSRRYEACENCGADEIIPADAPLAPEAAHQAARTYEQTPFFYRPEGKRFLAAVAFCALIVVLIGLAFSAR